MPLSTQADDDGDESTAAIRCRSDEVEVRRLAHGLGLEADVLLNLLELIINQWRGRVAAGVVAGEDLSGLLSLSMGNEPSWRLRHEVKECELNCRESTLQDGRDSPTPCRRHTECSVGRPSGENRSEELNFPSNQLKYFHDGLWSTHKKGIVERTDLATLGRVGKLGNENRRWLRNKGGRGTEKPAGDNEHRQASTCALESSTNEEKKESNPHWYFSAILVCQPCSWDQAHDLTDGVYGVHRSEYRRGRVTKVAAPLLDCLQTVHHST